MSMESKFTRIYERSIWKTPNHNGASGTGSNGLTPDIKYYLRVLKNVIHTNNLKTICDAGCGDWRIYDGFDWSDCQYLGLDCVASVIDNNASQYGRDNIAFQQRDITEQHVSGYDLVILKDVIQHWDDVDIIETLDRLVPNNKFVLVTIGFQFTWNPDPIKNAWVKRVLDKRHFYHPVDINKDPMKRYRPFVIGFHERRAKQMVLLHAI